MLYGSIFHCLKSVADEVGKERARHRATHEAHPIIPKDNGMNRLRCKLGSLPPTIPLVQSIDRLPFFRALTKDREANFFFALRLGHVSYTSILFIVWQFRTSTKALDYHRN